MQEQPGQEPRDVALRFSYRPGAGVAVAVTDRPTEPMRPLDEYTQKVLRSRARGAVYPYELAPLLAGPSGTLRRARPRRGRARWCRSSGRRATTGPASSPAS